MIDISGPGMPTRLRSDRPDCETALLMIAMAPFARNPISHDKVDLFRSQWRILATTWGRRAPVKSVSDHVIDGPGGKIVLRVYTPEGAGELRPAFLWCHGGAFVLGDLDCNDSICRDIARSSGVVVVSVRYRLAPEHDLYAGRDDFMAALVWVAKNGKRIGVDTTRLSIGGDSAGGNISAAVAQECRARGGPELMLQVLVYPATDLPSHFTSGDENAKGYFLTAEFIDSVRKLFGEGHDLTDPRLSPARAESLAGLPPALIITAGYDPVRDDGLTYAGRLREAGVPVKLMHYAGQFHGFLNFDSVISAAADAHHRIGETLARVLGGAALQDSTIEVGEAQTIPAASPLGLLTGCMMLGRSMRQVGSAMSRQVAPHATQFASQLFWPWWAPVAHARRSTARYLHAPLARQTYPVQA